MAIGARSVENQFHRLTASGLDIAVGMKNPTGGDLSVLMNSLVAAQSEKRIRLVEHSLVAVAGRARLVGVDARHDEDLVLHPVRHAAQTPDILRRAVWIFRSG